MLIWMQYDGMSRLFHSLIRYQWFKIGKYFLGVHHMGQLLSRSNALKRSDDMDMIVDSTRASPSRKRKAASNGEVETRKKKKISKVRMRNYKDFY